MSFSILGVQTYFIFAFMIPALQLSCINEKVTLKSKALPGIPAAQRKRLNKANLFPFSAAPSALGSSLQLKLLTKSLPSLATFKPPAVGKHLKECHCQRLIPSHTELPPKRHTPRHGKSERIQQGASSEERRLLLSAQLFPLRSTFTAALVSGNAGTHPRRQV